MESHVPQCNTLPNHAISGDMKDPAHGLIQHTKALRWWFVSLDLYRCQAIASCQIMFNVSSLHLGKANRGRIPEMKCTWYGRDSAILLMPPSLKGQFLLTSKGNLESMNKRNFENVRHYTTYYTGAITYPEHQCCMTLALVNNILQ